MRSRKPGRSNSDGTPSLSGTTVDPGSYTKGTFTAIGPGTPSVGQTVWINLGVFDPIMSPPTTDDIFEVLPKAAEGQKIKIEVQMAQEDIFDLGHPDLDLVSPWVDISQIATLNGNHYNFMRLRFTFYLASDQTVDDPVPYVDRFRLSFTY